MTRYVYDFDAPPEVAAEQVRALMGGKGANLAVMTSQLGLPVPPGFSITTEACRAYLKDGWPDGLDEEIRDHVRCIEAALGRAFGGPGHPLLVSVRSGAPVSMPGMMETILNLGLNEETERALADASGEEDFAAACRERFEHMYRDVVGVATVPADPWEQLRGAVEAVFRSWNGDKARSYRSREGISEDLGTGVNIQAMVFGNWGEDSATGVAFTRNPATGERCLYGDVMFGAQGEDIVAGTHTPEPIAVLDRTMPAVAAEFRKYADLLESHFRDVCDIEFTVERGKLWMLQVRNGKRTPQAALKIAVDMAEDAAFPLSRAEAVQRVARHLVDPPMLCEGQLVGMPVAATGLPASPGLVSGEIATTPEAAVEMADQGRTVILVRAETSPDDVHGMARAAGILTSKGGLTSHAAVVARGWGIPAIVGASGVTVSDGTVAIGSHRLSAGDALTIDGTKGEIYVGATEVRNVPTPDAAKLLAWAKDLGVDLASRDGTGEAEAPEHQQGPTTETVIRALFIKGFATPPLLAFAVVATEEHLLPVLQAMADDGVVATTAGMYRLTDLGRARGRELMAADQALWGQDRAAAALDGFIVLDHRTKEIVTAWQMRVVGGEQVLNDHTDTAYDLGVLADLAALHSDASAWLAPLADALPRLGDYSTRLADAAARVAAGEHAYIASPRLDSYHSIWFELHEDLIHLAGRTREDEVAAGRA